MSTDFGFTPAERVIRKHREKWLNLTAPEGKGREFARSLIYAACRDELVKQHLATRDEAAAMAWDAVGGKGKTL